MNPRVLEATAIEGRKLKLFFDNEEREFYDCSGLLNFGVFQELQDKSYFKKVKAVDGTVVWYLLTWNCTHIANAVLRPRIEAICRSFGYEPPTICTPQELMEV